MSSSNCIIATTHGEGRICQCDPARLASLPGMRTMNSSSPSSSACRSTSFQKYQAAVTNKNEERISQKRWELISNYQTASCPFILSCRADVLAHPPNCLLLYSFRGFFQDKLQQAVPFDFCTLRWKTKHFDCYNSLVALEYPCKVLSRWNNNAIKDSKCKTWSVTSTWLKHEHCNWNANS